MRTNTQDSTVDAFVTTIYPKTLDGVVTFIDELRDAGKVETLDDLRSELVKMSQACRVYTRENTRPF